MKISVFIPNWNGSSYLKICLESLQRQSYSDFEIIVVDNGSTDDSLVLLKTRFSPFIKLIELPENKGFDYAINRGIEHSQGEFIATLNNDTEVDPQWLQELLKGMYYGERVGMCASKILFFHNRKVIDKAGHLLYPDGQNRGRGCQERDQGQYDRIEEVIFPDACAALYRRSMLEEIGLFEETFFAYGDDAELGLRAQLFGWRCIYIPTAVVYHLHSATTGPYSLDKIFLIERNRLWLVLKLFPWPLILLNPYYTLIRYCWHLYSGLSGIGSTGRFLEEHSSWELIRLLLRAYWSAFMGSRKILKKRRAIQKKKRLSSLEIYRLLRKYRLRAKELALSD